MIEVILFDFALAAAAAAAATTVELFPQILASKLGICHWGGGMVHASNTQAPIL